MSREQRREMVDRQHPALSIVRQCALIGISRSSVYYRPRGPSQKDLEAMKLIDQQYLVTPFYGSRRMKVCLDRQGHPVDRKRVRRLMWTMGLQGIYISLNERLEIMGIPSLTRQLNDWKAVETRRAARHHRPESNFGHNDSSAASGISRGYASD